MGQSVVCCGWVASHLGCVKSRGVVYDSQESVAAVVVEGEMWLCAVIVIIIIITIIIIIIVIAIVIVVATIIFTCTNEAVSV